MKPTDKTHRPIYMTAAMVMTVLLAVTVLLAQDNPEEVILTEEEFQALLAAGGDTPVGTILTDEQFQVLKLFLMAAEKGATAEASPELNAWAQLSLGHMYAFGKGVLKDDAEAGRWYRLAADQGLALAQLSLGQMYADGEGVLKDDAEAVRWFRLAAEQGDADAQFNLGVMHAAGEGVLKDEAEAVRWFRLAAEQVHQSVAIPDEGLSDAELENLFAEMERSGPRQGHAGAQFNLGVMHAAGEGVLKDEAEAVRWYRLAAEQGVASAQLNLGVMHAGGRGVLKDSVLAHMWSNIAGANGNASARKLRDSLERDMTRAEVSRATELARECMASDYQDCEP